MQARQARQARRHLKVDMPGGSLRAGRGHQSAAHPVPGSRLPLAGTAGNHIVRKYAAVPGIVEPLTCRELEVLGMLAAGQPNQAIASQLVVTLDTVKKHVSHVLSKLGAANRTEAVSRA
jgi:DNA-binding NarL/FixJ family response regulator